MTHFLEFNRILGWLVPDDLRWECEDLNWATSKISISYEKVLKLLSEHCAEMFMKVCLDFLDNLENEQVKLWNS